MNVYEMMYCHTEVCYSEMQYHQEIQRKWFSGKIQRCHRWAPGSIPGLRKFNFFSFSTLFSTLHSFPVFIVNDNFFNH